MIQNHVSLLILLLYILLTSCTNAPSSEPIAEQTRDPSETNWDNATIYFLMTDRFYNGNVSNDYEHTGDNPPAPFRGFMGGDIAGITAKLNEGYFTDLGVTAIWMTPLVEQISGSVDEGTGNSFPFHGYWARDWTAIDKRFGTKDELKEMVNAAHDAGIKVLFDVVANHIGPVTETDPVWPDSWVKTGPRCQYQDYKSTTDCTLVDNLPDIRTESMVEVELPPYLIEKWTAEGRLDQEVEELDQWFVETGYPRTAVNYILKWLVDFIKEYGIDGFRVDTVKHTEEYVWTNLWNSATIAYEEYKSAHPSGSISDEPFYMVGEVYNYYISGGRAYDFGDQKVDYFDHGFHALINFDFKTDATKSYEAIFSKYDGLLSGDLSGKSVVNYISSHDDGGPYDLTRKNPMDAGTKLLLCPGAVQIYYGDESARSLTVDAEGDATLRSFMNWDEVADGTLINGFKRKDVLAHWQKLGTFRREHPSVGTGRHQMLKSSPYTFSRSSTAHDDRVIVSLNHSGKKKKIETRSQFSNGMQLYDYYSEQAVTVEDGIVELESAYDIVLLGRR